MAKLELTHIGNDSWDRPVYKDQNGKLWKDVDPRASREPELCTVYQNIFDGEPDTPMCYINKYKDVQVEFKPNRVTW